MKQQAFEQRYANEWDQFQQLLEQLEASGRQARKLARKQGIDEQQLQQFGQHYRRLCHFQSLAQERNYSSYLVERLADLVSRGHRQLYKRKYRITHNLIAFVLVDFPRLVRQQQAYFWLATALLYGPALLFYLAVLWRPDLVYAVIPPEQVNSFESMYNPSNKVLGAARESDTDIQMFGFYIQNNISVAFRTFASGIILGIGSLFFLIFNGLLFGAVAGHLVNVEYSQTFFPFVIGHGSFELTAIVIAGAAGLKLGHSLLSPGSATRLESLKSASQIAIKLMYGVILMLIVAAFLEAFWSSSSSLTPIIKYSVGTLLWSFVVIYFMRAGRQHGS